MRYRTASSVPGRILPLSARIEVVESRLEECEEGGLGAGTTDDGFRSSVTCTSEADLLGAPQEPQNRADSSNPAPH